MSYKVGTANTNCELFLGANRWPLTPVRITLPLLDIFGPLKHITGPEGVNCYGERSYQEPSATLGSWFPSSCAVPRRDWWPTFTYMIIMLHDNNELSGNTTKGCYLWGHNTTMNRTNGPHNNLAQSQSIRPWNRPDIAINDEYLLYYSCLWGLEWIGCNWIGWWPSQSRHLGRGREAIQLSLSLSILGSNDM
jgi:hypothetical protein